MADSISQDTMLEDAIMDDQVADVPDLSQETPPEHVFIAPSIDSSRILAGESYTYHSDIPEALTLERDTECVLGVDEAGRGPVLGPMVYGLLYLPINIHKSLLAETHHFDDSKVLTPTVRSNLMKTLCKPTSDLYRSCGWATRTMSARDISAGMLKATGTYNLNAQAMDATIDLIQGVFDRGVNVTEIYIDTIGNPQVYQKKLERIFPTVKMTVAKKADSLYPCVSAASVCAKVTRDAALEVCYDTYRVILSANGDAQSDVVAASWGSGYPSDSKCTMWLKQNMDPLFGWGAECRFSWGTAKDMLEAKAAPVLVDWPIDEDDEPDSMKVTQFFASPQDQQAESRKLANWFGRRGGEIF